MPNAQFKPQTKNFAGGEPEQCLSEQAAQPIAKAGQGIEICLRLFAGGHPR